MGDAETIRLRLYVPFPTVEDFRTLCALAERIMSDTEEAGYVPLIDARVYGDDDPWVLWLGHDEKLANTCPLFQFICIEEPTGSVCDTFEHSFCLTEQTPFFYGEVVFSIYLLIVTCMENSYLFIESVNDCRKRAGDSSLLQAFIRRMTQFQENYGAEFTSRCEWVGHGSDKRIIDGIIRGEDCAVTDNIRENILGKPLKTLDNLPRSCILKR